MSIPCVPKQSTDQCLCLSAVLEFVQTNLVAEAAALLVGQAEVITLVTQMVCGQFQMIDITLAFA